MKQLFTLLILVSAFFTGRAQNLEVLQDGSKLYLPHAVQPKENWYSIGRMFNVSPNIIAVYNGLTMDKGLSIGQKLKVPLNSQNLAQSGQPAADEAFIPVYHKVKEKEGLYRIGQTYNKVPVDQLKSWNKLKSDEVSVGTNLVVGYLKVKKDQSPLAGAAVVPPTQTQTQTPAQTTAKTTSAPANTDVQKSTTTQKTVETNPTTTTSSSPIPNAPGTEGAFAALYKEQSKGSNQVTGVAAIFKSTSGWKDGKYYVLMNKVTPGTIVKITSVSNSKSVYAKVLGEIPPGKENEGLLIRLSNAAGAQLQIADSTRFDVQLVY